MVPSKSIDNLPHIREEYGDSPLLEQHTHDDPIEQFKHWFADHLQTDSKTQNTMVLSTVDEHHHPDSRIVLLKELDKGEFIFYTQYNGVKGLQMEKNPFVALNFYWPHPMRQVRVRGEVYKLSTKLSDEYFYSRPLESQLSSIASFQSKCLSGREELEVAYQQVCQEYADKPVVRPQNWGGYAVVPSQIEFWQGRDNRLHDRIQYLRQANTWCRTRLSP